MPKASQTDLSVLDVAKYILVKAGRPMSTMQLQKLTYYCQAWNLAWTGRPLFKEDFQAWANGPVSRKLYDAHKGRYSITADEFPAGDPGKIDADANWAVDAVLGDYLRLTGLELSNLTHSEDPWIEARGRLRPHERSEVVIPKQKMREYYETLGNDDSAHRVGDLGSRA